MIRDMCTEEMAGNKLSLVLLDTGYFLGTRVTDRDNETRLGDPVLLSILQSGPEWRPTRPISPHLKALPVIPSTLGILNYDPGSSRSRRIARWIFLVGR